MRERFNKKLARSRLTWASHAERMGDEKLAKRADAQKVESKRMRGRLKLRWGDCMKRYIERVGEEWRKSNI